MTFRLSFEDSARAELRNAVLGRHRMWPSHLASSPLADGPVHELHEWPPKELSR